MVLVLAEIGLFRVYGSYDSRFYWAAHFLVGVIAAAGWLSAVLLMRAAPAPGQLLTLLVLHVYAMAPDLGYRAGVPHAGWMNVFLGHIWVHDLPGGGPRLAGAGARGGDRVLRAALTMAAGLHGAGREVRCRILPRSPASPTHGRRGPAPLRRAATRATMLWRDRVRKPRDEPSKRAGSSDSA